MGDKFARNDICGSTFADFRGQFVIFSVASGRFDPAHDLTTDNRDDSFCHVIERIVPVVKRETRNRPSFHFILTVELSFALSSA